MMDKALEKVVAEQISAGRSIVRWDWRPSAYRSSFPLEEIRVSFDDGTALDLIFKDLDRKSLSETVRDAKPAFLHDPLREIETYQYLLANHRLGTAQFYGAVVDAEIGRYWLFLEKVQGDELYKVGEFSIWQHAARWLAGMHHRFATKTRLMASHPRYWLKYDPEYYRLWMRRAQDFSEGNKSPQFVKSRGSIARLAAHYDRVVERLAALPATFIHGEFYASNVLIAKTEEGLRVCPVDWEMAGAGPGLIDLAALVSGRWTEDEKTALALAYHASLEEQCGKALPQDVFMNALDDCRLHLAVQWLGWSSNWSPPAEHAHDWLGEALYLAEKVGCL